MNLNFHECKFKLKHSIFSPGFNSKQDFKAIHDLISIPNFNQSTEQMV